MFPPLPHPPAPSPKVRGGVFTIMKNILFLFLLFTTTPGFAQAFPKAPVVTDKKVKSVTKYAVGYDRYSKESSKSIIEKFGYDATGNCIALDYYYQDIYPDVKATDTIKPTESLYDFRNKQLINSIKYKYTFDAKGQLTKILCTDQDGNNTTSQSEFNNKGQEVKIVYKTNLFTNTTHKKYDAAGNLVSIRIYENDTLLINKDSTVYNIKNQKMQDYRWDSYHEDFIYYTYNKIDSIASQYWVVSQADNPAKKDTSNIILYEYDDKNRHVHTIEYINTSGINDLHSIEYQYSTDGGYTVWFRKDDRITLTKTYDAKGLAVIQIEKPNKVDSKTTKYFHNADGLLDHVDIFNSEDRLIDKEVYEYVYW
jgi:hypothetical protein